jgi:hypothetical protein
MSRSWRWSLPVLAVLCVLPTFTVSVGVARADTPSCSSSAAPIYAHPGRERYIYLSCSGGSFPMSVTVDDAEHGTVTQDTPLAPVAIGYRPTAGYLGPDHFTVHPSGTDGAWAPFDVNVIVTDTLNTAPDCSSSDPGIVRDGETRNVHIQGCRDAENDPVDLEVVTPPAHGTLGTPAVVNTNSVPRIEWPYTPDAGYTGSDSFTYHGTDDFGAVGPLGTATITVYAADFNRLPSCYIPSFPGVPVWIVHGPTTFSAGCFDLDEDPLTLNVVTPPAHGALGMVDGYTFSYTPDAGYSGQDTVVYTASDGHGGVSSPTTKTLNVGPNHAPVCFDAVAAITPRATTGGKPTTFLLPCTDDDDDQLTLVVDGALTHGQLTQNPFEPTLLYTPDIGFTGQDVATFHVTDGNGGVSALRKLRLGVGEAPAEEAPSGPAPELPVVSPPVVLPPSATTPVDPSTARPATAVPSAAVQAARLLGGTPKGLNLGLGTTTQAFAASKAVAPGAPLVVFFCAAGCTVSVNGHLVLGPGTSKALRLAHRTLKVTPARPGVLKLTLTKAQRTRLAHAKRGSIILTMKTTVGGKSKSVTRRFAIRR